MQERDLLALNLRLEPESAINGLNQKLYEKMTASIKNVKTSYMTVEDHDEDQAKQEEQLNQLKGTGSERERNPGPKDRLKRTRTVSYLTRGTH